MIERIEKIEKRVNRLAEFYGPGQSEVILSTEDYYFLIEQAKRADKNAQDLDDMDRQLFSTQQQVERYRQVLEFYADKDNYKDNVTDQWEPINSVYNDNGAKARQALEGDEE